MVVAVGMVVVGEEGGGVVVTSGIKTHGQMMDREEAMEILGMMEMEMTVEISTRIINENDLYPSDF